MNSHLSVLIVGAGPTGLLLACELARHGVTFKIIDKKIGPTLTSNATWIQTRTIELLDQIGIAKRFLKAGHPCNAINLYIAGKPLVTVPLNQIDSTYPFILMLPQSETERLLVEYLAELNHPVEWSCELIDVKQEGTKAISTIKQLDGTTQTITSNWLIACDGANSLIREKCNVTFPGEDLTEQFMVADAKIDSFMSKEEIHLFFDEGTLFAASPLGMNKYRIAANIHQSHPRQTFYEKEVVEIVQERGHGAYYVTDISWISPFWIHGKIAQHMRQGSIFLAGDAAHIHAPVGGQGMNMGMQDAYNLAWKLALVIQGKANSTLLDSYHVERYPIVHEIVKQAENFTKMALYDKSFLTKLRKFSHKVLQGDKQLTKDISTLLSQVAIQYHKSPVINYEEYMNVNAPQPGTRAPDVMIDKSIRLYDYFRHPQHTVLIFTGLATIDKIAKIMELQLRLEQSYPGLLKIHVVTKEKVNDMDELILDPDNRVSTRYYVEDTAVYIIRPDNYIGYCSESLEWAGIEKFFQRYVLA